MPDELSNLTAEYMHLASGIYDLEETRKRTLKPCLRRILNQGLTTVVNADKTSPDGVIEVHLKGDVHETISVLLIEDKNEFGDGHCDPSTQAGLSMSRYWVQAEVSPLLGLFGVRLSFILL